MNLICRQLAAVVALSLAFTLALPLVASAHLLEKVDNFIIYMDQSGSMAYAKANAGEQKFDKALIAVNNLDQALPELGYDGSVALFAPTRTLSEPAPYKNGSLSSAVDGVVPPFNTMTSMGDDFMSVGSTIKKLSGKTALVLFTDGVSNEGTDPVAQAQALYSASPDLCIHTISYADTPEGKQTIDAIKALNSCSVVTTDADMDQFARNVLYDDTHVEHPKAAAPAPAPTPMAKEVITFNLLFGFDKSAITDEMIPVLEEATFILEEDPGADFIVSGHTDSTGTDEYNQGLSERRAASIKNWLVSNGISSSRLKTVGYGETRAKYNNDTKEGRKLNRRVELQTK